MASTAPISTTLTVNVVIDRVIDTAAAQRLAQLLFGGSTGVTVAASTGVAS